MVISAPLRLVGLVTSTYRMLKHLTNTLKGILFKAEQQHHIHQPPEHKAVIEDLALNSTATVLMAYNVYRLATSPEQTITDTAVMGCGMIATAVDVYQKLEP